VKNQVNNLFREFWKIKRQYKLYQIYPEIEHSLPSFLKLYSTLKRRGLNPDNVEWFANAMETGTVYVSIHTYLNWYTIAKHVTNNQKR
jgi:hypothetical protein